MGSWFFGKLEKDNSFIARQEKVTTSESKRTLPSSSMTPRHWPPNFLSRQRKSGDGSYTLIKRVSEHNFALKSIDGFIRSSQAISTK
jgi:hypothetical protein